MRTALFLLLTLSTYYAFAQKSKVWVDVYSISWNGGELGKTFARLHVYQGSTLLDSFELSAFQDDYILLDTGSYLFVARYIGEAPLSQHIHITDTLHSIKLFLRPAIRILGITTISSPNFGDMRLKSTQKAIKAYDKRNKKLWEARQRDKKKMERKRIACKGDFIKAKPNKANIYAATNNQVALPIDIGPQKGKYP